MSTQKTSPDAASQLSPASANPCQNLLLHINRKHNQLSEWQEKLEYFLDDVDSDLDEIKTLQGLINNLDKDLLKLKAQQKQLGCVTDSKAVLSNDSQSIISTSTVRRKDARALEIKLQPEIQKK